MPGPDAIDTVVLDVDGTLVDSNYHHVWAWCGAFREVAVDVPLWRVHRAIGMGADRLVAEVERSKPAPDLMEVAVGKGRR
jgi:phosphoglycolate phosphatase-like HAD superfamily hydrolase